MNGYLFTIAAAKQKEGGKCKLIAIALFHFSTMEKGIFLGEKPA